MPFFTQWVDKLNERFLAFGLFRVFNAKLLIGVVPRWNL